MSKRLSRGFRRCAAWGGLSAALCFSFLAARAQSGIETPASDESGPIASVTLPDAPGAAGLSAVADRGRTNLEAFADSGVDGAAKAGAATSTLPEASHTEKYIEPGQAAPKLSVGDKVLLGFRDAFSPFAAVGWIASAGYEQLLNGSPNYGTDRGAFGQRLGAAALRDSSEGVFSDSVMSPLLREDPRYYRMGPGHNFVLRLVYAGTRTIITRTDGGKTSPNLALLAGTLAGSALASPYYPPVNRGATQTMLTFGGSLGGTAVGDVVSEFLADVEGMFHPHKK